MVNMFMKYDELLETLNKYRIKYPLTEDEEFIFVETLKQIIKLESSPFNIVLLADYYFQKSKYDLARKYYEMAIDIEELKPSKYKYSIIIKQRMYRKLGEIWYFELGNIKQDKNRALYYWKKAEDLEDLKSRVYIIKFINLQDYEKQINKLYEKVKFEYEVLKMKVFELPYVYYSFAKVLINKDNITEAISILNKARKELESDLSWDLTYDNLELLDNIVNMIYKYNGKQELNIFDLFVLLKEPNIIRFKHKDEVYELISKKVDNIIGIKFKDYWFKDFKDFLFKVTLNEQSICKLYDEIEML